MTIFDVPLEELRRRTSIKWKRWEDDVLPMFVAEMDVRTPEPIRSALQTALDESDFGYPEQPIYQEAFEGFAQWRWGWTPNLENTITAGDVMQGMRYALEAASEPGDRVVINPPIYPPFRQITSATGRQIVEVPLLGDRLDLTGMEQAFQEGARVHLLCSPHNPNGTVHTREELQALADLAKRYDITVISDEIHAPFNGHEFTPFLALEGVGKAFVVTSAAKTFNLAGLKAALVVASDDAKPMLDAMPSYVREATSHIGVIAHAAGFANTREWVQQLQREIRDNKEFFARLIAERLPELEYIPAEGTYLAWLDCSPLGLEHPGKFFHQEARVRFNFGDDFGPEYGQFVRVNLAASPELIDEAVHRMASALHRHRSGAEAELVEDDVDEPTIESGGFSTPQAVASVVSNQGHREDLLRDIIVGRSPKAQGDESPQLMRVASPANDISRRHLRIGLRGWQIVVTDLNSTNGTLVQPPVGTMFELRDGQSAHVEIGTILNVGDGVSLRIEPPLSTEERAGA